MSKVTTVNQLQTSVTRIAGNLSTSLNTVTESLEEIENLKADKTVATTSNKALNIDLTGYVTKDGSKVLSTNDFTTKLKTKLEGIGTGNTSTAGLTKLYTGTGTNTDGTMTQSALKTALDGKLGTSENAASATKLTTARSLKVSLSSTSAPTFDGSANCRLSV